MAAALTMDGAAFCSIIMMELGFDESFGSVPLFIDNTSALHVAGSCTYGPRAKHIALRCNRAYSPRAKYIALRYVFVQELVEKGKVSIHYVKSEDQLADMGTKHLSKHHHRKVIKLINELEA